MVPDSNTAQIKRQTGTDFAASLSIASSATSGAQISNADKIGDFIVGGRKPLSPWVLPLGIVGAVIVAVLFLIRR